MKKPYSFTKLNTKKLTFNTARQGFLKSQISVMNKPYSSCIIPIFSEFWEKWEVLNWDLFINRKCFEIKRKKISQKWQVLTRKKLQKMDKFSILKNWEFKVLPKNSEFYWKIFLIKKIIESPKMRFYLDDGKFSK